MFYLPKHLMDALILFSVGWKIQNPVYFVTQHEDTIVERGLCFCLLVYWQKQKGACCLEYREVIEPLEV